MVATGLYGSTEPGLQGNRFKLIIMERQLPSQYGVVDNLLYSAYIIIESPKEVASGNDMAKFVTSNAIENINKFCRDNDIDESVFLTVLTKISQLYREKGLGENKPQNNWSMGTIVEVIEAHSLENANPSNRMIIDDLRLGSPELRALNRLRSAWEAEHIDDNRIDRYFWPNGSEAESTLAMDEPQNDDGSQFTESLAALLDSEFATSVRHSVQLPVSEEEAKAYPGVLARWKEALDWLGIGKDEDE